MPVQGIKFGLYLPTFLPTSSDTSIYELCFNCTLAAEKYGFDSVWISDHFNGVRSLSGEVEERTPDILECWTTLSALASQTRRIKIGTVVTCIPYRNPAVLAKMAATIDVITNGRLILGVGAGWRKEEFLGYGIPWESFRTRFCRTKEGIEIIKRLWTEPIVDYCGKYYQLVRSQLWPKPIQKPRPPIWLGALGPGMMTLLEETDGWLPSLFSPEEYKKRALAVKDMVKKTGRQIEMGFECFTSINLNYDLAAKCCNKFVKQWFGQPLERIERSEATVELGKWGKQIQIGVTVGGPEECIKKLEEFINAGVRHFILHFMPMTKTLEGIKMYADKVIPYFQESV